MQLHSGPGKKTVLAAALILLGVILYLLSAGITGFVTESNTKSKLVDTEQQLNFTMSVLENARKNIEAAQATIGSCERNLSSAISDYTNCNSSLSKTSDLMEKFQFDAQKLAAEKSSCENDIALCKSNLDATKADYEAAMADYSSLAASSAAAICCSFSDFQAGTTKQWLIESNKILCGIGNYTVNCNTGKTNI